MQNRITQEPLTFRIGEPPSERTVEENHHQGRRRGATEGDVADDSRAT